MRLLLAFLVINTLNIRNTTQFQNNDNKIYANDDQPAKVQVLDYSYNAEDQTIEEDAGDIYIDEEDEEQSTTTKPQKKVDYVANNDEQDTPLNDAAIAENVYAGKPEFVDYEAEKTNQTSPPESTTHSQSKTDPSQSRPSTILLILVAICILSLLVCFGCCWCAKKYKTKEDAPAIPIEEEEAVVPVGKPIDIQDPNGVSVEPN